MEARPTIEEAQPAGEIGGAVFRELSVAARERCLSEWRRTWPTPHTVAKMDLKDFLEKKA